MPPKHDFMLDGRSFQLRYRKCGSKNTQCQTCLNGDGHGPYWYMQGDFYTPQYLGKELPPEVTNLLELIETQKDRLKTIRANRQKLADEAAASWRQAEEETRAIDALLRGNHPDPKVLEALELKEFIFKSPARRERKRKESRRDPANGTG